jgi:hypothetical protein
MDGSPSVDDVDALETSVMGSTGFAQFEVC